jgi:hypothetical protein
MTIMYITKRFTNPWQIDHPRDKLLFSARVFFRNSFGINSCTVYTPTVTTQGHDDVPPVTTIGISEIALPVRAWDQLR